jgi:hypothetical protein
VADDRDSWGKTTTQPRELATREESPNGGAERRLAGSEGIPRCGENCEKGRKLGPVGCFYTPEEREGCVVPHVGDRTLALS